MEWHALPADELVAALDEAVVAVDLAELRVRCWSRGAERVFGWTASEAVGADLYELLRMPRPAKPFSEKLLAKMRAGQRVVVATEPSRKDGAELRVDWGLTIVRDAAGVEVGAVGVGREISTPDSIRRIQPEVARPEDLLDTIFATMHEGVVLYDSLGGVEQANPAAERILGIKVDRLTATSAEERGWQVLGEAGAPLPANEWPVSRALTTGREIFDVPLGVVPPSGDMRWLSVSAVPLRHRPGAAPYAVVSSFVDITEQRLTQERLRISEATLQRVLSGSRDGFFDFDLETGRAQRSARVGEMLGIDVAAIAPSFEGWLALVHPDDVGPFREEMRKVTAAETGTLDIEYRARGGPERAWRWLHTRARRSDEGGHASVSGTITDVTARHEANERLDAELRINARLVGELREALAQVGTLSGFLPICMHCHKIRNDKGFWDRLERYIGSRTGAQFSHGLCPDCEAEHYPDDDESPAQ